MDRLKLLVGVRLLSSWRRVVVVVQPAAVLRWYRAGFRLFWRRRSHLRKTSPLLPETIDPSATWRHGTLPAWQTMFRGWPDNARTFDHARRFG